MIEIVEATNRVALRGLYAAGWDVSRELRDRVTAILDDVRAGGDGAVVRYTQRFDHAAATIASMRVDVPARHHARTLVPEAIAAGLERARERVEAFHARQLHGDLDWVDGDATRYAFLHRPLAAVGAYVPGGTARLPSSVVMTVVPARVAGVERVAVCTPPRPDGGIDPAILYACALCGVDELYAVGGAQAIGALAYGTATIAAVDAIVGPGNVYVTEAKRQVFGVCGIDGLAGPSEVLVVADASADALRVAGEIVAQAEHDPLARVAAVSTDRDLLETVRDVLAGAFPYRDADDAQSDRAEVVRGVLAERAWLVHAAGEHDVLEVVERMAPEHLSLQVRDPYALVRKIRRAGAIFVGDHTPVAAGDYLAGTNHTLPTSGAGRFASGLNTSVYRRSMTLVEYSARRMRDDAPLLEALATFEGLPAHARTARMRRDD